jgi:hypothetical protein
MEARENALEMLSVLRDRSPTNDYYIGYLESLIATLATKENVDVLEELRDCLKYTK